MKAYDFSSFPNVELIGVALSALDDDQLAVLYQQARYCQAMTDADTDTLREIVSPDAVFTHMSGRQQTREEYHPGFLRKNVSFGIKSAKRYIK